MTYAGCCYELGILYNDVGQYGKAEALCEEAKTVAQKATGLNTAAYAAYSNCLGIVYADTGRYQKAEAAFLQTKQLYEKGYGKTHWAYANR